jgi:2-oxoisovalerate dehydrogenase E1 component
MTIDPKTDVEALFRALLLPRAIEEKMLLLIRQGRIPKWFSGYGQEAISVGVVAALNKDDYILPMHRNLGVWTTRGVDLKRLFCQMMGREGGFTKGRDRTFHFGLPDLRIVGMISQLAAMLPVADGLGLAAGMRKADTVIASFVGDGATREGDFHEALSLAGIWKLPVVFILENNGYGLSTPTSDAVPVENIADAGAGYGIASRVVDGNDVLSVIDAVSEAAERARSGEGATLLEMKTFRMRGHEEASGTKYVPAQLLEEWAKRDPVQRYSAVIAEELGPEKQESIRKELASQVSEIAEWALQQPAVTGTLESELADVFAPAPVVQESDPGEDSETEKRFIDAISDGLRQALESDESVVLLGQDIAEYGGVFKVTAGLLDSFGPDRIRNTPIVESGAVGAAMGMALGGLKPVLEIQYADFLACGFNQIVNNLSTTHYRWNCPVNVTIRAPFGGGIGAGPFHSQSVEAWFCHIPGLKVVVPSSPQDARSLLLASIQDPNPVLFLEHKRLYRSVRGPVRDHSRPEPLGSARVVREGRDGTVVSYGVGVHWALEEAVRLEHSGYSIEVIDLRTLIPWDRATILESVRKTGRLLVLHEAQLTGGFGGEIVSSITEVAFEYLDAPPVRIGAEDLPVPFSRHLEDEIYSARHKLGSALDNLLSY